MPDEPMKLFYSYAHADESLRKKLEEHLSLLRREGYISEWHDRKISPGTLWAQEINTYLESARIILLLISSSFIASDYCYGIELQEAMRKHEAGEARVIPIILRECDWKTAPFGELHALPKDSKPVTIWTNRDTAFADIAKGIRAVINELNGKGLDAPDKSDRDAGTDATSRAPGSPAKTDRDRRKGVTSRTPGSPASGSPKGGEEIGKRHMLSAPALNTAVLKKTIVNYYKQLADYQSKAESETSLRNAFQNMLADTARHVKWTLVAEQTIEKGIRPDGVVRDDYFARGYWEAKGPRGNLEQEIAKKISQGYPLTNTIFENTQRAVLYQNKKRFTEYDLQKANDVSDLIQQFFSYTEPDIENFETAVQEFKVRIPELAKALLTRIELEYKTNTRFIAAFNTFAELCRTSLDPKITSDVINEMLIQHLLTERIFRTIFDNSDFVRRNVIAVEIEKVIDALASRSFNRNDFLKALDRFYVAIEAAAKGIESWSERQHFLNTIYERFFQGYSIKRADTYGIVYTPQEIVDFMCASVDEVLKSEFGKSIAEPGVQILDPATGTGSFIVNLMQHHIPRSKLKYKYQHDLFCNEIMLLPYYITSLNIEHEYYAKMGEYEPFEGVCFVDTLELAEGRQLPLFVEENTERVQREKDAQIMVVIGNPPYNVGQKSENDNNKNRKYSVIDEHIRETYAKASQASNKIALSDAYVKFFRWATDRLGDRNGIVCLVTNNSFIEQIAFDGMRMHLQQDFTQIYHIDLHGNVRKNPKLSGTTHNVFGIQVGVGITVAVRNTENTKKAIYYHRLPENWRRVEKLAFLQKMENLRIIDWQELVPDERGTWITEGLQLDFRTYLPVGDKLARADRNNSSEGMHVGTIFDTYSLGPRTNRDDWVYDFNRSTLTKKVLRFVEVYNSEVDRWHRRGSDLTIVDSFVIYDDTKIKWSRDLKLDLQRNRYAVYNEEKIRNTLYRPFCRKYLFFDRILNEEVYQFPHFFPISLCELENIVIFATSIGADHQTFFASNTIVDLKCGVSGNSGVQCFPFYTYNEDGTNRRENIADWALTQFQAKYGPTVTKWDIFHYVYAMLHHPQYRERYAENLKRDLPHIPLLHTREAFETCVRIGKQLMDMHLNYEQAEEYKLEWLENEDVPFSYRVEKMKLVSDRTAIVINESLTLAGIPPECFEYRLGNRSALEWVIDQYQVSKDTRSGIESDPNRLDDEQYIVHLVEKVITVSVETVRLVNELAEAVKMEDWMEESVKGDS